MLRRGEEKRRKGGFEEEEVEVGVRVGEEAQLGR